MDKVKMVFGLMILSSMIIGCSGSHNYPINMFTQQKYYLESNITYEAGENMIITYLNNNSIIQFNSTGSGSNEGIWINDSGTAKYEGNIDTTKNEWGIWSNDTCIVIGNTSMKEFC